MPGPAAQQREEDGGGRSGARDAAGFAARCLLRASRSAVLATQQDGQPYASLVTPAVLPDASILLLLSGLALHTRHLAGAPRCALFVSGPAAEANPQTAPRLTVMGRAARTADPALHAVWLARHPYAALYAGFTDFGVWRLVPESAHFVAGFAQARRLGAGDFLPRPEAVAALEAAAPALLAQFGANQDALGRAARAPLRVQTQDGDRAETPDLEQTGGWTLLAVDCDGVDMVRNEVVRRLPFGAPVQDRDGAAAAMARIFGGGA